MKVAREKLLSEMMSVLPGTSSNETTDQSSCFVFMDKELVTFNDEIACRIKTKLDIEGAVAALPLVALLQKLSDDYIEVTTADNQLLISNKGGRTWMALEHEILLPIKAVEKPTKWHKLDESFGDGIKLVQECASTDNDKFKMTCVHIHPKWVEASDNYQAARFSINMPIDKSYCVRRDAIKKVPDLGVVQMSVGSDWVHFKNPDGLIISLRTYKEKYPSMRKLLKQKGEEATLPKGLADSCERVAIYSQENTDGNNVLVDLTPGKLRITGEGVTGGRRETKKVSYKGKPIKFRIPPAVLAEITRKNNTCQVSETLLKTRSGKLTYITSLMPPSKHSKKDKGSDG